MAYRYPVNPLELDVAQIPGNNLWVKAHTLALNANDPIASVSDGSPIGNTLVQATENARPLLKTGIINGYAAMLFDGSNDYLASAAGGATGNAAHTIIVVCRYVAVPAAYKGIASYGLTGAASTIGHNTVGVAWYGANSLVSPTGTGISSATNYVFSKVHDGRVTRAFRNGEGQANEVTTYNASDAKLTLGTYGTGAGTEYSNVYIAEAMFFNRALTDDERRFVEAYLLLKYNIGFDLVTQRIPVNNREFDPTMLSGCVGWMAANKLAFNNNDLVPSFSDLAGNANSNYAQGTANKQPSFITNVVNGLPVLRFSGLTLNTELESAGTIPARTVFVVANHTGTTFNAYRAAFIDVNNNDLGLLGLINESNIHGGLSGTFINGINTASYAPLTTFKIFYRDFAAVFTRVFRIGNQAGFSRYWNGDIAEIIVYNRQLRRDERVLVEHYLAQKYAISAYALTMPTRKFFVDPFFEDTFTRADHDTSLGTSTSGHVWTQQSGVWGIASNRAKCFSTSGRCIATIETGVTEGKLLFSLENTYNGGAGIVWRYLDVDNYWHFWTDGVRLLVIRRLAGAETTLFDANVGVPTQIDLVGNNIIVYKNNTILTTINSASLNTNTKVGLVVNGANGSTPSNRWDNLQMF